MTRRNSRIAAVQALYQYQITDAQLTSEEIISEFIDFRESKLATLHNTGSKFECNFFKDLLTTTIQNIELIDSYIKSSLPDNWEYSRLAEVTLSLLRLGVNELINFKEIPYKVIINEYIEITKKFMINDKERKFINGILNSISDNIRNNEQGYI